MWQRCSCCRPTRLQLNKQKNIMKKKTFQRVIRSRLRSTCGIKSPRHFELSQVFANITQVVFLYTTTSDTMTVISTTIAFPLYTAETTEYAHVWLSKNNKIVCKERCLYTIIQCVGLNWVTDLEWVYATRVSLLRHH